MKTVELGYISSDGTHFLFTPNLFDLPATPAVDKQGKEIFLLAFSKKWDTCMAQAQEQLQQIMGGTWVYGSDSYASEDLPNMDMMGPLKNAPKMALSQMTA